MKGKVIRSESDRKYIKDFIIVVEFCLMNSSDWIAQKFNVTSSWNVTNPQLSK